MSRNYDNLCAGVCRKGKKFILPHSNEQQQNWGDRSEEKVFSIYTSTI
jgi:hypothetical protein